MPAKKNPLKLNPLQLKTLTLLQELARDGNRARMEDDGGVTILHLPQPHGDHFHVGRAVVSSADATGLKNEAVWVALQRKGLAQGMFPMAIKLTREGIEYETGLRNVILHGADH